MDYMDPGTFLGPLQILLPTLHVKGQGTLVPKNLFHSQPWGTQRKGFTVLPFPRHFARILQLDELCSQALGSQTLGCCFKKKNS